MPATWKYSLETMQSIVRALNAGNHDRSDIMTDYFDVGWYVSVKIGHSCDKPFRYVPAGDSQSYLPGSAEYERLKAQSVDKDRVFLAGLDEVLKSYRAEKTALHREESKAASVGGSPS